jgi:hypothetical protein
VLPKLVALSFALTPLLPSGALAVSPTANFPTEAQAQQNCPANIVFRLNLPTGIYHAKGQRRYGRTKSGAYVCRYIVRVPRQRPAKPCILQIGGCKRPFHIVAALQPSRGPGGRPGSAAMTYDVRRSSVRIELTKPQSSCD